MTSVRKLFNNSGEVTPEFPLNHIVPVLPDCTVLELLRSDHNSRSRNSQYGQGLLDFNDLQAGSAQLIIIQQRQKLNVDY